MQLMWGSGTNQIVAIKGDCGKVRLHVLIDTGSTHNLINENIIRVVIARNEWDLGGST